MKSGSAHSNASWNRKISFLLLKAAKKHNNCSEGEAMEEDKNCGLMEYEDWVVSACFSRFMDWFHRPFFSIRRKYIEERDSASWKEGLTRAFTLIGTLVTPG
jgi:hypothetical protein